MISEVVDFKEGILIAKLGCQDWGPISRYAL